MAFKAAIREEQFAAAASITIGAYPRTPVAGDTIIIALSNDLGTTVISTATSGWTMIGTQAAAAAHNCGVAWAKYSGGVPTLPTFSGTNATWNACIMIIPDAAASPIGGYQRFHLGAEYSHDSNSVAYSSAGGTTPFTASSKSLLLYVASCDGANLGSIRFKAADVTSDSMMQTLDTSGNALSTLIVGHRHIETGATVPACTLYSNINSEGGPCWVIEILNATGGSTQPDARTGIEEKFWYGNFQTAAAPGGAITWESLVPLLEHAGVGPKGLKVSDLTGTTTNGVVSVNGEWGSRTQISCTRNIEAAFGAGVHAWVGAKHTFSAVDMRGLVAVLDWDISIVSTSRQGEEGQIMFFGDASNNYVAFQLRPRAGTASSQRTYQTRVALGASESAEVYASYGTLDWQNVTQFGVAYDRFSTATGATALEIRNLCLLSSTAIVSGGVNKPATFSTIVDALGSWGILGAADLQSAKQVLLIGDVQIGDGTNPVYFDSAGEALGVPAEWVSARYSDWNAAANTRTISIKTTASDTVLMRAGSIVTPVAQSLVIDATAVAPAEFSVAGEVCLGLGASTWHSDFSPTGMTYQDSGLLDGKAATFTGCYFTNGTDSSGQLKLADGGGALSCVFTQGGSALYAIKIDAAGDYYINGSTFSSGYTKHINITATTGTVTIYKDSGDATPTYDTAGATVVIDTPTITADISITGMPVTVGARRRLQIINQTGAAAATRANSTAYAVGDVRVRQTGVGSENTAGLYLRCTTGGTSAGSPPTWNTTPGGTTTDGTVVWTTYAVLYYDADPAAATLTDTYIDGAEFLAGEIVEVRFAEEDPAVAFSIYSTSAVAASTGFSALVNEEAVDVYATYGLDGIDGDTVFSPNYAASYIVLDTDTDFAGALAFAYYCYLLTTSDGMYRFWGGLTALDAGNIRNNVDTISLYFDESAGFVKQTDDVRIFRSDGARPAIDPTTGGNGIEINWRVPVNVVSISTASVLSPTESAKLMGLPSAAVIANEVVNVVTFP